MTTTPVRSFVDFGVEEPIAQALAEAGISTPFPIQELTLPLALSGADIIGQARTGTGKTLAFGIPLLSRVDPDAGFVQALVIVPTRELCLQVTGDLQQAGVRKGVAVAAVYGGRSIEPQEKAIAAGAAIVVGTPGRLLDLMRRGTLRLGGVTGLVLDEADEMLDLGFLPDVEQLIEATAADRQTLLFSATMPSQVVALARRYMRKPTFLRADVEEVRIAPRTEQHFFSCHRMDKPAVLARILQTPKLGLTLVFTRTRRMADILAEELRERGIQAAPIHSDLRQEARERALARFRRGKLKVLVATEVAARGLDIDDVTHVVNYDCPDDEKMYLHRIGRTGRAGAAGVAVTLAVWNELARLEMIKRALDITVETHEVFSTSPILDELFDLPPRAPRQPVGEEDADDEDDTGGTADGASEGVTDDAPAPRPRRRRSRSRQRGGQGTRGTGGPGHDDGATDHDQQGGPLDPVARTADAETPEARTADAETPEARTADAETPEARTADAETPEARTADAETPEAETVAALARGEEAAGQPEPAEPEAPKKRRRSRLRNPFARRRREEEAEEAPEPVAPTPAEVAVPPMAEGATAVPSEAPADAGTPSGANQAAPAAEPGVEGEPRVRVRRRGRRGGGTLDEPTDGQRGDAEAAGTGTAATAGERPASGDATGRPAARRTVRSRTGARGDTEHSRAGETERARPTGGGSPGKGKTANRKASSRNRRGSGRDRGGQGSSTRRPQPSRVVDAAEARGPGKPMLQRPLTIAHLP